MEFAFFFLFHLDLLHVSLPFALEGILLIRAVSPATPQGSVSQPDSDTHTQKHRHTNTFTKSCQVPTHTNPYRVVHAHRHTPFHLAAILTSCLPGEEQLKDAPISPPHNNLSNPPVSPLHGVSSPSQLVSHFSFKLTGDMMIEKPHTRGRMVLVRRNA